MQSVCIQIRGQILQKLGTVILSRLVYQVWLQDFTMDFSHCIWLIQFIPTSLGFLMEKRMTLKMPGMFWTLTKQNIFLLSFVKEIYSCILWLLTTGFLVFFLASGSQLIRTPFDIVTPYSKPTLTAYPFAPGKVFLSFTSKVYRTLIIL